MFRLFTTTEEMKFLEGTESHKKSNQFLCLNTPGPTITIVFRTGGVKIEGWEPF